MNDALPGDAVSPEQIDDVMSMFGDNDVEVVDAQKASEGTVEFFASSLSTEPTSRSSSSQARS